MDVMLVPRRTPGAVARSTGEGWLLRVPAGPAGAYRLAQVDDYAGRQRRHFPHRPPCRLQLRARLSEPDLPGTWGFGFWNDPFGLVLAAPTRGSRLPVLPQAAWFFHASPPSHLSLRPGVPGNGFFAGSLRSPRLPGLALLPSVLGLPLLGVRPFSRLLRRWTARLVRQEGAALELDISAWHDYAIHWREDGCEFRVDGQRVLESTAPPGGPLALVFWIDNQHAFWRPDGRVGGGTLANPDMDLELEKITVE